MAAAPTSRTRRSRRSITRETRRPSFETALRTLLRMRLGFAVPKLFLMLRSRPEGRVSKHASLVLQ